MSSSLQYLYSSINGNAVNPALPPPRNSPRSHTTIKVAAIALVALLIGSSIGTGVFILSGSILAATALGAVIAAVIVKIESIKLRSLQPPPPLQSQNLSPQPPLSTQPQAAPLPSKQQVLALRAAPPTPAPAPASSPFFARYLDTEALIDVQDPRKLLILQFKVDDTKGTPGVNRAGASIKDRQFTENRIQQIHREISPHAHTGKSYNEYANKIQRITFDGLAGERGITTAELVKLHQAQKSMMMQKFGRQLSIDIIGAGPIGLSAALAFYNLGFQVSCYEKRSLAGSTQRRQPFSLMRQSYWFLTALGVSSKAILNAFGCKVSQEEIERVGGTEAGAEFLALQTPHMEFAKRALIGERAAEYIPGTISLPIGRMQQLLLDVITEIRSRDKDELNLNFNAECTKCEMEPDTKRRKLFLRMNDKSELATSPDIIYNASGGKINEALKLPMEHIATYYGMGAFFPPSDATMPRKAPEPPQQLSRAIRVFCSYSSRILSAKKPQIKEEHQKVDRVTHETSDPIYCNVELSEEEFLDKNRQQQLLEQVAQDVGLKSAEDFFALKVNLQHTKQAADATSYEEDVLPQLTICGGDSLLQPHFITASGANFGLLGLIELNHLVKEWLEKGPALASHELVVRHYNEMASLLQKQSCQTILNIFGRTLVNPSAG